MVPAMGHMAHYGSKWCQNGSMGPKLYQNANSASARSSIWCQQRVCTRSMLRRGCEGVSLFVDGFAFRNFAIFGFAGILADWGEGFGTGLNLFFFGAFSYFQDMPKKYFRMRTCQHTHTHTHTHTLTHTHSPTHSHTPTHFLFAFFLF